jgi:hypothetical protein
MPPSNGKYIELFTLLKDKEPVAPDAVLNIVIANAPLMTDVPVSLARTVIVSVPTLSAALTESVDPPTEKKALGSFTSVNVYARVEPPDTESVPTTVPTLERTFTRVLERLRVPLGPNQAALTGIRLTPSLVRVSPKPPS